MESVTEPKPVLLGANRATHIVRPYGIIKFKHKQIICNYCGQSVDKEKNKWLLTKSGRNNKKHYHLECAKKAGFDII